MDLIFNDSQSDVIYRKIIRSIPMLKNGVVADSMKQHGICYEKNWGVSIVDLKNMASAYEKNHLLALKLWNKKWRETMILAAMLDNPAEVTEEQMDYWIKTSDSIEIIEQLTMHLFVLTPFAFAKSMEWCRGKKYNVKYAGLLMIGRLASRKSNDIDEMFEPYFEILQTLSKDTSLAIPISRSVCQLSQRSAYLQQLCVDFIGLLDNSENENSKLLGTELKTIIG